MESPQNPQVAGIEKIEHDGMPDAGHEEQANRAGGQDSD